jgi:hypothetical protein
MKKFFLVFLIILSQIGFSQSSIIYISDSPLEYEEYFELKKNITFPLRNKIQLLFQQIDAVKLPVVDIRLDPYTKIEKSNQPVDKNAIINKIIENGSNRYKVYCVNESTHNIINSITSSNLENKTAWDVLKMIIDNKLYKNYERIFIINFKENATLNIDLDSFSLLGLKDAFSPCEEINLTPQSNVENTEFQWRFENETNFNSVSNIVISPKTSKNIEIRQCFNGKCGNTQSFQINVIGNQKKELIFPWAELNAEDPKNENEYTIYGEVDKTDGSFYLYRNGKADDFYIAIEKDLNIDSAIMVISGISKCKNIKLASFTYTRNKSPNINVFRIESEIPGLDRSKFDAFIIPCSGNGYNKVTFFENDIGDCLENKLEYVNVLYEVKITAFDCSRKVYDSKKLKLYFSKCP